MHELSIAQSIIDSVLAEAEKAHATKVLSISLRIGELSGVFADALSFCFGLCVKGTIIEGAELKIEKVPIRGYCGKCDQSFLIQDSRFICDACGNLKVELTSGRELQISELVVDD